MKWLVGFLRDIFMAIVSRLRLLAPIAAAVGIVFLGIGWLTDSVEHQIRTSGVETTAQIAKTTVVSRRRGSPTYELQLAWNTIAGGERTYEKVRISNKFAETFVKDGRVFRQTVAVKYLPDRSDVAPLVLDDFGIDDEKRTERWVWLWMAIGGLAASAWLFWPRRQRPA